MAAWEIVAILVAAAFAVLLLYFLYSTAHKAFESVGFTKGQATAILLGTWILSGFDIPLLALNDWILGVNVGGALVPVVLSILLLSRKPSLIREALASVALVSLLAWAVVDVTPQGISAPIYVAILPPLLAAAMSLLAHWRYETYAAPLAYIGGSLGSLIGADLLHLADFVAQTPPEPGSFVSMGGAGVFDMVFLSGIIAVGLDILFFRRFRQEVGADALSGEVFTTSTPPEIIRDWTPRAIVRRQEVAADARERLRAELERRRAERERPGGTG